MREFELSLGVMVGAQGSVLRPLPHEAENNAAVGSWVRLPYPDLRGQPVAQVREVLLEDLYLPELNERGELQPEKRGYVAGYVARLEAGEELPNIQIVEMEDGRLRVVDGHRRCVSALRAGRRTIRATVAPLIEAAEGMVPLTVELAAQSRTMTSLRDIEEPVVLSAAHGALLQEITHLRFFLNEDVIRVIRETHHRVNHDSTMGENDAACVPFVYHGGGPTLGARLERGHKPQDSQQIVWVDDMPRELAEVRVFYDGIDVRAKSPLERGLVDGEFVMWVQLLEHMNRYEERLRQWRAQSLGSQLEAAMGGESGVRATSSRGPGPI